MDDLSNAKAAFLGELNEQYHFIHTENSKIRLLAILRERCFRMRLQQESIEQLHRLVHNYNADPWGVKNEVPQSRNYGEKLRHLHGIEGRLQELQLTRDQALPLIIHTICLLADRIGNNRQAVECRLNMMHERNNSVWLLGDGLDWLLPEVHISLLLHQPGGDTTSQFPVNEQKEVQLQHKFASRLEDWRDSLDRQQRLHSKLCNILQCWPQYPWVR